MPTAVKPMAATLSTLPPDLDAWGFEIKWDGVRTIAYVEPGRFRLVGRNLRESTRQYPEVAELSRALGQRRVVVDGEIIAFDDHGRPSFQRIQPRIHVTADADIRHLQATVPVIYVLFDLVYIDGQSLLRAPYQERRQQLDELALAGPHWQTPAYQRGEGDVLLAATRQQGLEGVLAKRLASTYQVGRRSRDWLKVKNVRSQEMVIGGWLPGHGQLSGTLGSLLVGYYDDGEFQYAGKVGTGLDRLTRDRLLTQLTPLHRDRNPFTVGEPQKDAIFVEPRLVCMVEFAEWTSSNTLRHPSYQGLRADKPAAEVVREEPVQPL